MGVLIAVSLVLGSLIFRETRITREFLDAGRAYYAAESGVEIALYGLNNYLPGWQPSPDSGEYKFIEVDSERFAVGEYRLKNRCKAYPCFDDEEFDRDSLGNSNYRVYYDVLDLNRSITIPLFVAEQDDEGVISTTPVTDFTVEFFAPFNPHEHFDFDAGFDKDLLAGWDILRWKIFGINKDPQARVTESISDFTALSMINNWGDDPNFIISSNATVPSWFGTIDCDEGNDRYTDQITCPPYFYKNEIKVDTQDFGQISKIDAGTCSHTEAREFYLYKYYLGERKLIGDNIRSCYPIEFFIQSHDLNYLTLTNLINPAVFKDPTNNKLSQLFFRVELFSGDEIVNDEGEITGYTDPNGPGYTVREYADITANGYSGDSKQSINVKIKRGSFMPVFHFSLYSTYMDESAGHDNDYWYGSDDDSDDAGPAI